MNCKHLNAKSALYTLKRGLTPRGPKFTLFSSTASRYKFVDNWKCTK